MRTNPLSKKKKAHKITISAEVTKKLSLNFMLYHCISGVYGLDDMPPKTLLGIILGVVVLVVLVSIVIFIYVCRTRKHQQKDTETGFQVNTPSSPTQTPKQPPSSLPILDNAKGRTMLDELTAVTAASLDNKKQISTHKKKHKKKIIHSLRGGNGSWKTAAASLGRKSVASVQWVGFPGSLDETPQNQLCVVNGETTLRSKTRVYF
ncbi:hypothetical protein BDF14DRAFT_903864 [Spinellus fusiger]|nr:hypothetical protein BDF14DRAFT_903864 [Spinellus fusiger]